MNTDELTKPYWCERSKYGVQNFVALISSAGPILNDLAVVKNVFNKSNIAVISNKALTDTTVELNFKSTAANAWDLFQALLSSAENKAFDVLLMPCNQRNKKVLICDMDSTIVSTESLDDVAAKLGIGDKVSQITERAMRGELDFKQSLSQRIALLKDCPEVIFQEIANELKFNPGVETLIRHAKARGVRTVLVSGGLEAIVKPVAETLGFDHCVFNIVEVLESKLTGKVEKPIVDSTVKLDVLKEQARQLDIESRDVCAIGDGANDLPMLKQAGLGIAYRAKPLLRQSIPYQINHTSLEIVATLLNWTSLNNWQPQNL